MAFFCVKLVVAEISKENNTFYLHEVALQKKKMKLCSRLGPSMTALPAQHHLLYIVYSKNYKMSTPKGGKMTALLCCMI